MTFTIDRRNLMIGMAAMAAAPVVFPRASLAQEGDTLRIRLMEEVRVFDPAFFSGESESWVIDAIYPKLVMFKASDSWSWELYSAASLEQPDPKTVVFSLKQGLQWSNGFGEVTAEDVKYSYERFGDPELQAANAPNWGPLDHVEVTGKYTGVIHLKEPYSGLFGYVLPHDGGQIICKKAFEAIKDRKIGAEVPASAGAYRITDYKPGQMVVLERNKDWNGTAPEFARIELVPISDTKAAENAVLAGDLDWAIVGVSAVPTLKDSLPANLALEIRPSANFVWLGANMSNDILKNENIRKAIHMAVDRDTILEGAYFGVAEPSYGLATKGAPGHVSKAPFARDVEGARQLIEASGFSGTTLQLEVPAETDKITAAQIIQANLAEIGLTVNINQHEAGAFWSLPEQMGKSMQLFLTEWVLVPPDMNWVTQWFLPEQAGTWNWQYFADEEFKKLHLASSAELDPDKRNGLLLEMQKRLDASYSTFVITHLPRPVLYNKDKLVPAMKPNAAPRLDLFKKA